MGTIGSPGKDNSTTSVSGTGSDNSPSPSALLDHASVSSGRAGMLSSKDVVRNGSRRMSYESRISQYRRKRKRERKRKIIAACVFLVCCIMTGLWYFTKNHPENMETTLLSLETSVKDFIDQTGLREVIIQHEDKIEVVKDFLSRTGVLQFLSSPNKVVGVIAPVIQHSMSETNEVVKDFLSRAGVLQFLPSPNKLGGVIAPVVQNAMPENNSNAHLRNSTTIVTTKTSPSASFDFDFDQIVDESTEICTIETCEPDEVSASLELTSRTVEMVVESTLRTALDVSTEKERTDVMHRPWACNIPFAYLFHPRCFRLAKQNPVFDLQELISSMFQ
jgi:hypothetical protein